MKVMSVNNNNDNNNNNKSKINKSQQIYELETHIKANGPTYKMHI